jgi:hypothetical protein
VYQTDLPSYARAYRFGRAGEAFAWRWLRGIHNGAVRTLAPSTVTATGLLGQGIENIWLWGRGVDTQRFHPAKRSPQIRAELEPEPEPENTEPKYPEPESTGLARLNLNFLSKPSGNLQLYECLPSARLKVRNRFSKRNEKT